MVKIKFIALVLLFLCGSDVLYSQTGFAMGRNGTLLKTTNGGTNWILQTIPTTQDLWSPYFINTLTGWIVGGNGATDEPNIGVSGDILETSMIMKTTDAGNTWVLQSAGVNHWLTYVYFMNLQTGWISGAGRTILKTTNGGTNWNILTTDVNNNRLEFVYFANELTGFVTGWTGTIYKTTDGGLNWITQNTGITSNLYTAKFFSESLGYAAGSGGNIIKTTNGGTNWILLNTGITQQIFSIYFLDMLTAWGVGDNGRVIKTTNSGNNWITQNSGTNIRLECTDFINAFTGWAVGGWNGFGIIKTTDGGTTWNPQSSPTTLNLFSVYFPRDPIGINIISSEIPQNFNLDQNYPNPFNPATVIKFQVSGLSSVKINVFDVLGKEVEILVNEQLQPGIYEIDFVGTDFPSGIYYYRIKAGDYNKTMKMVLVK